MIAVSNLATSGWPQVAVRSSAELTSVLHCTSDFYFFLKNIATIVSGKKYNLQERLLQSNILETVLGF